MPISDIFSLQGRAALLTGGAARIVKPMIQALGEAGATVFVADLNGQAIQHVAKSFSERGLDVRPHQVDLSDEKSILSLRDDGLRQSGKVEVLVNAAVGRTMSAWQDAPSDFRRSMDVNAVGLFMITRAIGEVMKKQKSGSIINIASIHARRVAGIQRAAREYLCHTEDSKIGEIWAGLRPCTPDGLPIIARSQSFENLILATGHGMLGVSLGPITGKLVSQIALEKAPDINISGLSAERY